MSDKSLRWTFEGREDNPRSLLYPTNSLDFLEDTTIRKVYGNFGQQVRLGVNKHQTSPPKSVSDPAWRRSQGQARWPLEIIVIGAGLGGLATAIALSLSGHKVRVYEQAPAFGEVGAGIQVPPNSTRYLLAWGVGKHIEKHISEPYGINIRRWKDGSRIGLTQLRPDFEQKYGAPYWVLHRADYHSALLARAQELGVDVHPDCEVKSYDLDESSTVSTLGGVTFTNGVSVTADLIIGADGVKSLARTAVLSSHRVTPVEPRLTGQAAYRCTVPLSVIKSNPVTKWISDTPNQNLWIGPGRHAMTYPIGGVNSPHRLFNLVLSHPEQRPPAQWTRDIEETKAEMRKNFDGFEPKFTEVIRILSEDAQAKVVKWPIATIHSLPTWIHQSKRLVVVGDSSHAMVPYMSQGAAMAVEDAAAIAAVLSEVSSQDQIGEGLQVFEEVRMKRTGAMKQASWLNGEIWHLGDGKLQVARDAAMAGDHTSVKGFNSNQWSDPLCQAWTYGYDAVEEVQAAWRKYISADPV